MVIGGGDTSRLRRSFDPREGAARVVRPEPPPSRPEHHRPGWILHRAALAATKFRLARRSVMKPRGAKGEQDFA